MERVVVFGRGGAGKSTFTLDLSRATGLPVVDLDKQFWSTSQDPLPPNEWARVQKQLAASQQWILDGDLGPYDAPATRLRRADTVVISRPVADPVRVAGGAACTGRRRLLAVVADLALAQPRQSPERGRCSRPAGAPQRPAYPGASAPLPRHRLDDHLVTPVPDRGKCERSVSAS